MRVLTRIKHQDDMAKEWSEAVEAECKALIDEAVLAEREACAKLCDDKHDTWRWDDEADSASGPRDCAAAIRARENK